MKTVILGSAGRLGAALARRYASNCDLTGLEREQLDIGDLKAIERTLDGVEFDMLILTAGLTAVDYCEENDSEAFLLNADAPGAVARICAKKNARMVHFSTDFVFDGTKDGFYTEKDSPNPVSVYGSSKLRGEEYVLDASDRNLVIRLSWVFGSNKPAFPEWIIDQACSHREVAAPTDKVGCPTYAKDVGELLQPLLFGDLDDKASGIIHLCNSGVCSNQEWGQFCVDNAALARLPVIASHVGGTRLDAIRTFAAKRPPNSAMSTEKYTRITGVRPRSWREATSEYLLGCELFQRRRVPVA